MKYLVYLLRSLRRRPFRHLALVLILISAMTMPMIVSIYRASALQGVQERVWEFTRGHDFVIRYATEDDLPLFSDIPGLAATYEGGTIYLRDITGAGAITGEANQQYSAQIMQRMEQSAKNELRASNVTLFGADPSLYHAPNQMYFVSWLISAVALGIFLSAYGNHLRLFRSEIGTLRGIGASRGQIVRLFLAEYMGVFLISGMLALGLSVGVMKLLFVSYLEIRYVEGLATVVFHVNMAEMLQYLAAFFLIGSLAVIVIVLKDCRQDIQQLSAETFTGSYPRHVRRGLKHHHNAEKMMAGLYLQRLSRVPKSCAMLAVPVLIIVIFAIHYLAINLKAANTPPDDDIRILSYDEYEGGELLSEAERKQISQMDGILSYEERVATDPTDFLIADQRMEAADHFDWMDIPLAGTAVHRYSTFHDAPTRVLDRYEVTVTANHAHLPYQVGDTIRLYQADNLHHGEGDSLHGEPVLVTVVATEDLEWTDRYVDIFLSDELYDELTKDMPVNRISIRLSNPSDAKAFAERLAGMYPAIRDGITEFRSAFDAKARATPGAVIMFAVLLGMMLFFVLTVQLIRISEDMKEQTHIRYMLRVIGASDRMLCQAHFRQMAVLASATLLLSFMLGYGLLLIFFNRTGYHLLFTWETVLAQLLVVLCTVIAFFVPVFILFRKKVTKEVTHG